MYNNGMNGDLVTIIVPIYKVEQYLDRCVDSLVHQSYANIEIILVDDGSPDNCPSVCDAWAQKDNRIKVIHKANGGMSDARNAGIKIAEGSYICFVDSDDYVSTRFVEHLYWIICHYNVSVSAVSWEYVYSVEHVDNNLQNEEIIVFQNEDALKELLIEDTYSNYAWNKMYKACLFKDIQFPIGRKMEDMGTAYKILIKAGKIAFSNRKLYYYYQRPDSILHTLGGDFYKDKFELALERYETIRDKYPCMKENDHYMLNVVFDVYPRLYKTLPNVGWDMIAQEAYSRSSNIISQKEKIKYQLFKSNKLLYCLAWRGYKLCHL